MAGNPLIGAWHLVSLEGRFEDGRVNRPLGTDVDGYLIYSAEGWVSAMLLQANRKPLDSGYAALTMLTAEERESVLGTMTAAYQATYTLNGDEVTHHVKAAVHPNMAGRDEVRRFSIDGSTLRLTAQTQTRNGLLTNSLVWQRVEA